MIRKQTVYLCLSAMFLALALLLPFLTGQIPRFGNMFSPMHLPVLLCGFICGKWWGAGVGLVAPILRFALFQMPPMPGCLSMMAELCVYGLTAGLLFEVLTRRTRIHKTAAAYISLLCAMLLGRIVWGIAQVVVLGVAGTGFSWQMFVSGAFLNAWPAILLQLALVPPLALLIGNELKRRGL